MLKDILVERRATIPEEKIKERSWILVFRYKPSLQILLACDDEGKWSFPGGQLDDEETAEEAAWRELKEETGIVPKELTFLKTIYHQKEKLKVSHVFYTEITKLKHPEPNSDVEKLKWVSLDKLPTDLSKPKLEVIDLAKEKVSDVKTELKECIIEGLNMGLPFEILTEGRKRKTHNGFLIVFEGIDGAGKTTQRKVLTKWLENKGWKVTTSKWSTSPEISELIKHGKQNQWLTPSLFSLLHASDMIWRYENEIKPALERGNVVICDRYYYTSYARDLLRGVRKEMLDEIYRGFVEPDMVVHFVVPPRLAVERLMKDKGFKWYSSGMDIGYDDDMEKSATIYEANMDKIYRELLPKTQNYKQVNSERSIREIFEDIRGHIHKKIKALERGVLEESTSFMGILKNVLLERMSFRDLFLGSESGRKKRARTDVSVRPLRVTTIDGDEAWTFSYKSHPSTTGHRWKGYIRFLKGDVSEKENAEDLECMVDCECPDYRYRFAYSNAQAGAGITGPNSWNKNNGQAPRPRSQGGVGEYGPQCCKHLLALGRYLKTQVTSDAPEPEDTPPVPEKKPQKPPVRPAVAPQTIKAPDPDTDSYTDSRTGSDTMQESKIYELMAPLLNRPNQSSLYRKFEQFVKTHPEFDVEYEDDPD